jgi:hypothetical protein
VGDSHILCVEKEQGSGVYYKGCSHEVGRKERGSGEMGLGCL